MGAIAQSIFGKKNAEDQAAAWSKYQQKTDVPEWLSGGSEFAIDQAKRYAQRPYQAFQGPRVAGQSANQQQATALSRRYASNVGNSMGRAPSATQLSAFENPYVDDVLGARKRNINEEYGRQAAALTKNQAATDAFRSGRSDLARSRLAFNRTRAIDDATAETKAGAFDSAVKNYFTNQNQQQSAFQTAAQSLSGTGAVDRAFGQQQLDQDYQNFLDKRDWNINNLGPLIQSISAARGGSVTSGNGSQGFGNKDPWGAIAGLVGQGIMSFAGNKSSGYNAANDRNSSLNQNINNANNSGPFDWGGE